MMEPQQATYHGKASDDCLIRPCLGDATPLKGEEKRGDHSQAENRADPVEVKHTFPRGDRIVKGRNGVLGLDE